MLKKRKQCWKHSLKKRRILLKSWNKKVQIFKIPIDNLRVKQLFWNSKFLTSKNNTNRKKNLSNLNYPTATLNPKHSRNNFKNLNSKQLKCKYWRSNWVMCKNSCNTPNNNMLSKLKPKPRRMKSRMPRNRMHKCRFSRNTRICIIKMTSSSTKWG